MLTSKRVPDDYTIISTDGAGNSGTITIDASGTGGLVLIPGDLTIMGTTTTVGSVDLEVTDNIITVNAGELGSEVTLGTAGVRVDRGSGTDAFILFEENTADGDIWVVDQGTGTTVKILTSAIGAPGALLNIVEDTTPQLGGDLDVNSQSIIATTNNDIPLTVTGSGDIILTSANTGNIRFDGPAVISGPAPNSTPAAGDVALYQGTDTGGGTQILFENDTNTGELVSKTKAMVFGLIF